MGILLRKKLLLPKITSHNRVALGECTGYDDCGDNSDNDPLLPPPAPDFDGDDESNKSNLVISTNLLLLICFLGAFVILICFVVLFRKYRLNRRRRNDQGNEEVRNEDEGPELIHPIWLINTVGLQQSVVDSIEIFKYKRDQVLIEGSDCSVCLSEFQEDESLRLLPKCSHAFHIPCIDTWLRSHKNCPVCRAPIVVDTNNVEVGRNLNGLRRSREEDSLVSVELGIRDQVGEDGVQTDSADQQLQPRRRSISMDSTIHFGDEAYSLKKADSSRVGRKGGGYNRSSSGIFGVMKSSSFRRYSEKRPVSSIKRSFSSSGKKWSKQRSSRSQEEDSILPF